MTDLPARLTRVPLAAPQMTHDGDLKVAPQDGKTLV
jgi:hypothetical protein